jgi:hypothetical protein
MVTHAHCQMVEHLDILKNGVFWDVTPWGSCKALTRATWRNIPEDTILHSHRCENLKSYIWAYCPKRRMTMQLSKPVYNLYLYILQAIQHCLQHGDCTVSGGRMRHWWIGKNMEERTHSPTKVWSQYLAGEAWKPAKDLSCSMRHSSWDSTWATPKSKFRALLLDHVVNLYILSEEWWLLGCYAVWLL